MTENKFEKGTLGWYREQQKKKTDQRNIQIEEWKKCGLSNIFKDKGFNNEDREDWFRFWLKVDIKDDIEECWNWTLYTTFGGYGYCRCDEIYAHRLAYLLSRGTISDGFQVQHNCNNRRCCNPNHLELGDHVKNAQYMIQSGRGRSQVLKGYQVREILELHKDHPELKQWQIGIKFMVDQGTISAILNGKSWHGIKSSKIQTMKNNQDNLYKTTVEIDEGR